MRKKLTLFAFLFCCVCGISGEYCWGVMTSIEPTVKVYSIKKIDPNSQMRAIEIGGSGDYNGILLSQPKESTNSPLFDAEKKCDGWLYSLRSKQDLPAGKIWILIPSKWKIMTRGGEEIVLKASASKILRINILKHMEGFDIHLKSSNHEERGYYYLGYDMQ